MARTRASARIVAILAAAATLAVACGDDQGDENTSATASSPIQEFLGQPDFVDDPEAAQAFYTQQEQQRQEVIAQCMVAQGFEYTPVDTSQFDTFIDDIDDWGSDEWVAEWGFGITTQRFSQQQVGPNLKGWDNSQIVETDEGPNDPNSGYVEGLSEQEREAYHEALYGGDDAFPTFDESMSDEEIDSEIVVDSWEPQGCEGEAYANDPMGSFYTEFGDDLEDLYTRAQADPRIKEREAEISSCVADKGLEYTSAEGIWERWEEDLSAIDPYMVDGEYAEPDFGVSEEEMNQMSEDELEELFDQPFEEPELSEDNKAKLAELQAEEIELAVAVNECGGGFASENELFADVRAEYEQEFLDTHADELEQYRTDT